ncbi:MAG TPA: hypothetical protein VH183_07095 [Burkholderiaceae bacterium]|jgi:hypothetical protein|nr:hypothetical protein [Burkholderiaceae bacterium]
MVGLCGTAGAQPRNQAAVAVQAAGSGATQGSAIEKAREARLTVDRAVMAANGSMLEVRFTVPPAATTQWIPTDQKDTYVVDETSGERFFVLNLVRIGPAAQVRMPKGGGSSYVIFDNRHERLKPGATITVVIGALKQEHVKVAEQ